ncbi:NAD(P)-binding protein [Cyathus striatus]|nr:NAD(P)-binding protein [Cyathus striatus]
MLWFSKPFDPNTDIPSLKGKIIIVTGGNAGIGVSTVKLLANKGAKVYLGARTQDKFNTAYEVLKTQGIGEGEVVWLPCDLSTPQKAKESAEGFLEKESRLDILVNNAGMTDLTAKLTFVDGIPDVMMVNHIGPFVFTHTLLPLLIKTSKEPDADVRIVTVTSGGHKIASAATNPELDFKSIDSLKRTYENYRFSVFALYCVSKLGNVLFSAHLQSLLTAKGHNITCTSLHPGAVNTFSHRVPFPIGLIVRVFFKAPDVGAYTSVIAAAHPEAREWKGKYLEPIGRVAVPSKNAMRGDLEEDLWVSTGEYLKSVGIEFDV